MYLIDLSCCFADMYTVTWYFGLEMNLIESEERTGLQWKSRAAVEA